jgi:hypothetical protein
MHKKTLAAMTAVGLAAAIAVPTIAFGNARNNLGSFNFQQVAETPLIAQLTGANEVGGGDTDGFGAAAVTIDIITAVTAEVCWDLTYGNISNPPTPLTPPTAVDIDRVSPAAVVVSFTLATLGPSSASGCAAIDPALAQQILDTPDDFNVNVHTTANPDGAIRGVLSTGTPPAGEAHMLAVPLRAYDSRQQTPPTRIAALETRTISLATGKDGLGASAMAVPPGATAAIVTLTVTDTVGPGGFLKLYSNALTVAPATSSINWSGTNQNLAVTTQVAVDSFGSVKVTGGANATNFIIDVIGYLF